MITIINTNIALSPAVKPILLSCKIKVANVSSYISSAGAMVDAAKTVTQSIRRSAPTELF
jgi:hypothetical protein